MVVVDGIFLILFDILEIRDGIFCGSFFRFLLVDGKTLVIFDVAEWVFVTIVEDDFICLTSELKISGERCCLSVCSWYFLLSSMICKGVF